MAEFIEITLLDPVESIDIQTASQSYIQISATSRISLLEIARLCRYVTFAEAIVPNGADLPESPGIADYFSYLLGHSLQPSYENGSGSVTVKGGDVVICDTLSELNIDLSDFSEETGWNNHQDTATVTVLEDVTKLLKSTINPVNASVTVGFRFLTGWDDEISQISNPVCVVIQYVGTHSGTSYFFLNFAEYTQ